MGISEYVAQPIVVAQLAGIIRKIFNKKKEN